MSYTAAKARLLRSIGREVRDARVLDAIRDVPRELFVPPELAAQAYDDVALSIGEGQTISQPLMVAIMLQALDAQATDTVLDVGTGSGYQAALLSHLAAHVVGVERIPVLIERARAASGEARATNVDVREAGPVPGAPALAPFHRIVRRAAAPSVHPSPLAQLPRRGRAGLQASERPWARERGGALLVSDAVNHVQPSGGRGITRAIHTLTQIIIGLPLVDNGYLEDVAREAAARQRWEFMVSWQITAVPDGTASPFNAIATF